MAVSGPVPQRDPETPQSKICCIEVRGVQALLSKADRPPNGGPRSGSWKSSSGASFTSRSWAIVFEVIANWYQSRPTGNHLAAGCLSSLGRQKSYPMGRDTKRRTA